jgi:hypothetical protein
MLIGDNVDVVIWSVIESFTAVICACLMTLRPLIVKYLPAIFPASKLATNRSKGYGNPNWGQGISSKYPNKLRRAHSGVELLSEEGEARTRAGSGRTGIVVRTSWVAESKVTVSSEGIELPRRPPAATPTPKHQYK